MSNHPTMLSVLDKRCQQIMNYALKCKKLLISHSHAQDEILFSYETV